jgi:hypothetical protein
MNLATGLRPDFASSVAAFVNFPDTGGYCEDEDLLRNCVHPGGAYDSWNLHPTMQECYDPVIAERFSWRMDGSAPFGSDFFRHAPLFIAKSCPNDD